MYLMAYFDCYVTKITNGCITSSYKKEEAIRFNSLNEAFRYAEDSKWEKSISVIDENNADICFSYNQYRTLLHMRKCLGLTEDGELVEKSDAQKEILPISE